MPLPDIASETVVVVHPGVQHSRELVRALHEEGLLSRFYTSSNGAMSGASWLPENVRRKLRTRTTYGVPTDRVVSMPWIEIMSLVATPFLGSSRQQRLAYNGLEAFDRLAARRALSSGTRIVVGFESSCLHTFRRARSLGILCVLDAASVHYAAQPDAADHDARSKINAHKAAEIELANRIVVLSTYARDTYAAAGVPKEKLSVVAPGASLYGATPGTAGHDLAGTRFLFAGNVKHAKGIDLLLEAFSALPVPDKRLEIAGMVTERDALPDPLPAGVSYLGKLDRPSLMEAYTRAHLLVQPSRADGFSFVVAEAMGTGLPVIVSSAVGAKDLVSNGNTGWIFESGNASRLLEAMETAIERRAEWPTIGERARRAVAGLTWDAYRKRTRTLYRQFLLASQ